jgi:hypothetical protein
MYFQSYLPATCCGSYNLSSSCTSRNISLEDKIYDWKHISLNYLIESFVRLYSRHLYLYNCTIETQRGRLTWKLYLTLYKAVVVIHTTYCDVNNPTFIRSLSLWTYLIVVNNDCSGNLFDLLIFTGDSESFLGCKGEKYVLFKNFTT